ncbi:hypothetical protein AB4458_26140 [Vibrio sp. 10N.261.45.F1]|uniref:hypothetical protein n=1 Tax=unclassified Vibrio TaxID=2614977 RepID=UPI00354E585D
MKRLLSIGLMAFLAGCSHTPTEKETVINQALFGTKQGAAAVINIDYHYYSAAIEHQNYKVALYLSDVPDSKTFQICEGDKEVANCQSEYSIWQNVLMEDQNGIWLSYKLSFPMNVTEEDRTRFVKTKNLTGQTFLEWNKTENIYEKNLYVSGKETKIGTMTITAHPLR